jgi:hypothetical protein
VRWWLAGGHRGDNLFFPFWHQVRIKISLSRQPTFLTMLHRPELLTSPLLRLKFILNIPLNSISLGFVFYILLSFLAFETQIQSIFLTCNLI